MGRFLGIAAALVATGAYAITPEQMLSAPRRSTATPNPSGDIALFSVTEYSFENQTRAAAWQLLDLKTGEITDSGLSASEVSEVAWLPGTDTGIIYINGTNEDVPGGVTLWIGDIKSPSDSKRVASLDAPFSGLRVAKTSSGDVHFLVNALAFENGTAYNAELVPKPRHSGRLYENIYARHWDTWLDKQRYAVFGGSLLANASYGLANTGLRNFLQGVEYNITKPESPVQPGGGNTDYDISPDGSVIAFLSKATHLNKAEFTASYIYVGPFDGSKVAVAFNGPDSEASAGGHKGASGAPTFSPEGSKLSYFQLDEDNYESDRAKLYVVDVSTGYGGVSVSNWKPLAPKFDRSVGGINWAPDGESIFVTAEDYAITRAFNIPVASEESFVPERLTNVTSVTAIAVLPDKSLLVSSTSIWTSRDFYVLKPDGTHKALFSATAVDEQLSGLGSHTYEEFFYTGSLGIQLHALIVKPSNFVKNKTYPLAYIIHGGPQGSNGNVWSTRWNPQLWADQGYVVVAPNPSGSTGFGEYLTDSIQGNWGSYPYEDIVLGWEYVKENLSYVDTDNGIVAGASFGGYMTNWIQGHALGREFKAIVTHDGVSNTEALYASEELWFLNHDFNGTLYDEGSTYKKWNPSNHIANFSTPQFVVHNTLDYRLPESDGLALFNILQSKGIPSRFLNFPDENHQVFGVENSLFWNTEIFNWINHYSGVGGKLDDAAIGV